MNCYFLVEGKETEVALYPKLISYFLPEYKKVDDVKNISKNNYCIFAGYGYPDVVDRRLKGSVNLIKDINTKSKHTGIKIDSLIIVIDADRFQTFETANQAINQRINNLKSEIKAAKIKIYPVIQNRCIESWFLANDCIFPKQYDEGFKKFVDYYNVNLYDPEKMGSDNSAMTDGQFAYSYLCEMALQNGQRYSKNSIDYVSTNEGINAIYNRYKKGDIHSFKTFLDVIEKMKNRMTT